MPSPLLFFIFIIIIDLILKSARDKKKIDIAKERRQKELSKQQPSKSRPIADLRKILEEEIQKERQKARQREITKERMESQPKTTVETNWNTETPMPSIMKADYSVGNKTEEVLDYDEKEVKISNIEKSKINPKKDIIKGIIFSEILSKPKCLQNQRRSL